MLRKSRLKIIVTQEISGRRALQGIVDIQIKNDNEAPKTK
jgi:hypothetical protein